MDVFNEKSLVCASAFEKAIDVHGDSEFDVFPIMTQCALDIICGNFKTILLIKKEMISSRFFFF